MSTLALGRRSKRLELVRVATHLKPARCRSMERTRHRLAAQSDMDLEHNKQILGASTGPLML